MKRIRWILVGWTCGNAEGQNRTSGDGAWGFLRERRRARERAYPLGRLLWVLSCSATRKYPSGGTAPKYSHKFTIPQSKIKDFCQLSCCGARHLRRLRKGFLICRPLPLRLAKSRLRRLLACMAPAGAHRSARCIRPRRRSPRSPRGGAFPQPSLFRKKTGCDFASGLFSHFSSHSLIWLDFSYSRR